MFHERQTKRSSMMTPGVFVFSLLRMLCALFTFCLGAIVVAVWARFIPTNLPGFLFLAVWSRTFGSRFFVRGFGLLFITIMGLEVVLSCPDSITEPYSI